MQNMAIIADSISDHSIKKTNKMKMKIAKEFFVTENGEIIKMAAIVAQDPTIIRALQLQKEE